MLFAGYETERWYDEFFEAPGLPRSEARLLIEAIESLPEGEFERLQESEWTDPVRSDPVLYKCAHAPFRKRQIRNQRENYK